jgi:hypothetical protein
MLVSANQMRVACGGASFSKQSKGSDMLWNVGTGWLVLAITVVVILSFILALGLDAVMGKDGFGATGNLIIISTGFFMGILVANMLGYRLADLSAATMTGLAGAFVSLFTLASLKLILNR